MVMKLRPESDQADVQAFVQQLILIGTYRLESFQDFLIELDMKLQINLVEISTK